MFIVSVSSECTLLSDSVTYAPSVDVVGGLVVDFHHAASASAGTVFVQVVVPVVVVETVSDHSSSPAWMSDCTRDQI